MTITKDRILGKQHANRSTFFSFNNQFERAAIEESTLELDYYRWQVFTLPEGSEIKMQPNRFKININGVQFLYTPDSYIRTPYTRATYDEIKYVKELANPELVQKHKLIKRYFKQHDSDFRVLNEHQIRVGKRVDNISRLMSSLHHQKPTLEFEKLITKLPRRAYYIGELHAIAHSKGINPSVVNRAMAHKLFDYDITLPWTDIQLTIAKAKH